jgi:hypothetical protein
MKKMEYKTPVNEVIEIALRRNVLLSTSSNENPNIGGEGDDEEAG